MIDVKQKFTDLLVNELGISPEEVKPEAKLVDDLGCDSLDIVELVMGIEETFDIEVPDEDVHEANGTVAAVIDLITAKLQSKEQK